MSYILVFSACFLKHRFNFWTWSCGNFFLFASLYVPKYSLPKYHCTSVPWLLWPASVPGGGLASLLQWKWVLSTLTTALTFCHLMNWDCWQMTRRWGWSWSLFLTFLTAAKNAEVILAVVRSQSNDYIGSSLTVAPSRQLLSTNARVASQWLHNLLIGLSEVLWFNLDFIVIGPM